MKLNCGAMPRINPSFICWIPTIAMGVFPPAIAEHDSGGFFARGAVSHGPAGHDGPAPKGRVEVREGHASARQGFHRAADRPWTRRSERGHADRAQEAVRGLREPMREWAVVGHAASRRLARFTLGCSGRGQYVVGTPRTSSMAFASLSEGVRWPFKSWLAYATETFAAEARSVGRSSITVSAICLCKRIAYRPASRKVSGP